MHASALLLLLLLLLTPSGRSRAHVYAPQGFPIHTLSAFERSVLLECPCRVQQTRRDDADHTASKEISLCLPVVANAVQQSIATQQQQKKKKEVFAFSVTSTDQWKSYDWEQLTTVAWNEDKELLCRAHSKGVKVVIKHNFDDVDKLCDPNVRAQWIQETYTRIVTNFADGVNIDTEKAMHGEIAKCMTALVKELRQELQQHAFTQQAQITFDVSWAPRGVDGRYYQWKELADVVDFLFVMSYDMRSQIYYQCIAAANSPLALVKQGLQEFILGYGIDPKKLVLGVPWYGYKYTCEQYSEVASVCGLRPVPFFGAPCSDAAGEQMDFGAIMKVVDEQQLAVQWDAMSQTPFVEVPGSAAAPGNSSGRGNTGAVQQIWFDDPRSLRLKYELVRELGLLGAGMWNADTLDYSGPRAHETRTMWAALASINE
uniref:GH18 domain-containing protein n=1 Tax=Globisporangium ultimum (strain ATCC 200006 / CBS 805.95 / DAOM BR144) TaxID=431595 RepID=K3WX45_GLOUD